MRRFRTRLKLEKRKQESKPYRPNLAAESCTLKSPMSTPISLDSRLVSTMVMPTRTEAAEEAVVAMVVVAVDAMHANPVREATVVDVVENLVTKTPMISPLSE